ncbi:hypothetical protein D5071_12145 [Pectobacterium carotovorum]|uniref:Uncharacterized protein n=1 Tax=Pectobacterium carotovorum TaxID=554 RepID=A0A419AVF9_PECCA|nr:hypothetical protein D5071_12145 [Pectobacterium carotovorum]
MLKCLSPSYFKLHVCWLSSLTPVTYLCKLLGIRCVAACLQLELFRGYLGRVAPHHKPKLGE